MTKSFVSSGPGQFLCFMTSQIDNKSRNLGFLPCRGGASHLALHSCFNVVMFFTVLSFK